jgi:hypothetical protein
MTNDLRVLGWLRWKQFQDEAVYWLRVLGYQPDNGSLSSRAYILYLFGICGIWVGAMWTWAHDQAHALGGLLNGASLSDALMVLPFIMLGLQVFVMMVALNSTPLKLTFEDISYIAGSPISPAAPVFIGFVRQVLTRVVLISLLAALITIFLSRPLGSTVGGGNALRAILIFIPFVIATWAIGWVLGVLRLIDVRIRRVRILWVLPLLLIPAAVAWPDGLLWPGRSLILYILGHEPAWLPLAWLALAVVLVWGMTRLAARIDMVQATDESILYARIQSLGLMAWKQIDVQLRIRMQSARGSRKALLRLPDNVTGFRALAAKAAISYIRHPFMLLFSGLWGAVLTQIAVLILAGNPPVQVWILWLLVVGAAPPLGMLYVFSVDVEERFLRQFLPVNGFELLIADILLPLIATVVGGAVVIFANGIQIEAAFFALLLIGVLSVMLALCGAVALTSRRVLQMRLLATTLSFGALIVGWTTTHSPLAVFGIALVAILILSGMVTTNA